MCVYIVSNVSIDNLAVPIPLSMEHRGIGGTNCIQLAHSNVPV